MTKEMAKQITDSFQADFEGTITRFVSAMFAPGADPALLEWIVAAANRTDREAAIALMADFANVDMPAMMKAARVPIRALNAAATRPGMQPTAIEGNRRYADFDAVLLDGVGHYPHLEKPAQFNADLHRVLANLR
jgi:pimeloyl-ACP methyl ester carboxylesterase